MKIGIAATSYGPVSYLAYENHVNVIAKWASKYDIVFRHSGGLQQHTALNDITKELLDSGCSHILYIEHDNIYPDNLLERLLQANKPCVSGLYHHRRWPYMPVPIVKKDGVLYNIELFEHTDGKCFEVDIPCFGCCLVQSEILKELGECPFDTVYKGRSYTADVVLFSKIKDMGHLLWVLSGANCGHITDPFVVLPSNFRDIRDLTRPAYADKMPQKIHIDLTGAGDNQPIIAKLT